MKRRKRKVAKVRETARVPYSVRLPRTLVEEAKKALDEETVTATLEEALRREVERAQFRKYVEWLRRIGGVKIESPFE
ncbi:MAG: hypothetical protein HY702_04675 [Gemmatimonadetes bacterium]|nr:hypothetical protein [Gemmatimonadota bacterium]